MPNIWRTNHEQSDINETWPVMIYSIDICCFYKFKTKLASIRSIFLVFIRASDLFFPFNERTEGIFEFRRTWSLEMQMRSITRDVCALNLSKLAGFRPASVWSPGDGLQHDGYIPSLHQTSEYFSDEGCHVCLTWSILMRKWPGSRAHGSGHFGNLTKFVTWPRLIRVDGTMRFRLADFWIGFSLSI